MRLSIYTCIYILAHVRMSLCMRLYIYISVYTPTYASIYLHMRLYTYICIYETTYAPAYLYIYINMYIPAYIPGLKKAKFIQHKVHRLTIPNNIEASLGGSSAGVSTSDYGRFHISNKLNQILKKRNDVFSNTKIIDKSEVITREYIDR